MDHPTGSARILPHISDNSQQCQNNSVPSLGGISQTTSTSTTPYPSPTNNAETNQNLSQYAHQLRNAPNLHCQTSLPQSQSHRHEPFPSPSPSAADIDPFFGRAHSQTKQQASSHSQHQQEQRQQQTASHQPMGQNLHRPHRNSISQSNNFSQPGVLPADFLAEAAKRAQMACLMRDLCDVSL